MSAVVEPPTALLEEKSDMPNYSLDSMSVKKYINDMGPGIVSLLVFCRFIISVRF